MRHLAHQGERSHAAHGKAFNDGNQRIRPCPAARRIGPLPAFPESQRAGVSIMGRRMRNLYPFVPRSVHPGITQRVHPRPGPWDHLVFARGQPRTCLVVGMREAAILPGVREMHRHRPLHAPGPIPLVNGSGQQVDGDIIHWNALPECDLGYLGIRRGARMPGRGLGNLNRPRHRCIPLPEVDRRGEERVQDAAQAHRDRLTLGELDSLVLVLGDGFSKHLRIGGPVHARWPERVLLNPLADDVAFAAHPRRGDDHGSGSRTCDFGRLIRSAILIGVYHQEIEGGQCRLPQLIAELVDENEPASARRPRPAVLVLQLAEPGAQRLIDNRPHDEDIRARCQQQLDVLGRPGAGHVELLRCHAADMTEHRTAPLPQREELGIRVFDLPFGIHIPPHVVGLAVRRIGPKRCLVCAYLRLLVNVRRVILENPLEESSSRDPLGRRDLVHQLAVDLFHDRSADVDVVPK